MLQFKSAIDAVVKLIETLGSLSPGTSPLLRPAKEAKLSADFVPDKLLQDKIDAAGKYFRLRTGLEGLRLAVVYLPKSGKPVYAGFHDQEEVWVFSVAKLLVMYAAFQLWHDLSKLAARSQAATQDDLIKEARDQWAKAPEQQVKNIVVPDPSFPKAGPPDLKRIFTMVHGVDGWKVDFTRSNKTIEDLAGLHHQLEPEPLDVPTGLALLDQLGFLDRMKLAIGWSDNIAAATCVRDVGYPYMAALALQSGLYDYDQQARNGPGGLWLGGDYTKGAVAGPWKVSPVGEFPSAGTAKALATFMTLLARDRLVDPKASADMRDLMDHLKIRAELLKGVPKGQTVDVPGSFFFQGLRNQVDLKAVYQKIGVVNVEHEAALIEVGPDEPLWRRYVLVALGAVYRKDGESLLAEVAAYLDRSLQSWLTTGPRP